MGSIFSSTSLPKEEQKEDGWVIVDEEEALAEAKVEEEEEEEEIYSIKIMLWIFFRSVRTFLRSVAEINLS